MSDKRPDRSGCEWHMHSMNHRCPNGLTLSEYLFGSRPHTIEDALKIAKDKEAQK